MRNLFRSVALVAILLSALMGGSVAASSPSAPARACVGGGHCSLSGKACITTCPAYMGKLQQCVCG